MTELQNTVARLQSMLPNSVSLDGLASAGVAYFLTPGSRNQKLTVAGSVAAVHFLLHKPVCASSNNQPLPPVGVSGMMQDTLGISPFG
jgi:hypothetical protein